MKPIHASTGPHPSRLALAEFLAGEASPADRSALESHVQACPDCAAKLREATAARDAFAAKYPSWEYFSATRRARSARAPAKSALRAFWDSLSPRPAIAIAALLILAIVALRVPWTPSPSDLSAKGSAEFHLFVNGRASGDSVACKPGDTLQLGIIADRPVHFAVLYRDDEGALQTYMDEGQGRPLGNPRGENLPHSLILERGWQRERLYCIWSYGTFDSRAARAQAEGKAVAGLHMRPFLLLNSP
ncbi:MAG: zf-HC2 domain-containing protein [Fibrobacteres bacterium]|nr:zf-HC2 domain-containing protein [Fibrobacterota bacterium]